jgi:DNA-binding NtrC family response regulator
MNQNIEIIVVDDNVTNDDPLMIVLQEEFSKVHLFTTSGKAWQFISQNLTKKFVIILDLQFPKNEMKGKEVLEEIRKISKTIPVIIRTAYADQEEWRDYINYIDKQVFAFFSRSGSDYDQVVEKVKEAAALLDAQVETALEDWINLHKEDIKNKPYLIAKNGKTYTLNDMLNEIRMQTLFGRQIEKDILMLTIDLIARNKEKLRD